MAQPPTGTTGSVSRGVQLVISETEDRIRQPAPEGVVVLADAVGIEGRIEARNA